MQHFSSARGAFAPPLVPTRNHGLLLHSNKKRQLIVPVSIIQGIHQMLMMTFTYRPTQFAWPKLTSERIWQRLGDVYKSMKLKREKNFFFSRMGRSRKKNKNKKPCTHTKRRLVYLILHKLWPCNERQSKFVQQSVKVVWGSPNYFVHIYIIYVGLTPIIYTRIVYVGPLQYFMQMYRSCGVCSHFTYFTFLPSDSMMYAP